ncbi:hypothetical protein B5G52_03315 [Pseudoalteromonas sp. A601]|nr:hypothetical protein B5G52_03315 [Pseudoalteromonas sp. A601]
MIKLKNLTEIRLGMAFKSAIKDLGKQGIVSLIQAKDILPEGLSYNLVTPTVNPESDLGHHIIKKGELLIRLRGPVFSSIVFDKNYRAVTTNQVAVISCDDSKINPYYLNWYLNSKHGRRYFDSQNEGTNINKISSKALNEMEIMLPSLETQLNITKVHNNWLKQRAIHQQLISNGDMMNESICDAIYMDKSK